uniref:non-specific serine/threonine protein kinase n=1 Tax=Arcella intermedia TaxID=1963864 RepID=A0A6B2L876_9EUKA
MLKDKLNSQKACKLEDFEIKQKLGQGAFGEVWLAVDKFTGNKVALKQMHKQFIISKGKKEHVTNEKKLLNRAKIQNSRFLLTLYTSFQTINDIYLAMEYCPGGDLREFLEAIGSLEEEEAKLWFAEMIIAVHSLHKLGYIHRDLKPDNFLIDAKGHIKLGDFGLSKQTGTRPTNFGPPVRVNATAAFRVRKKSLVAPLQLRKAYSVVGSPQYMSPEVLKGRESSKGTTPPSKEGGFKLANQQNQGYSEEVDWWSLGCVFFECILGEPPFSGDSVEEVFNSIENWSEVIPETLKLVSDSVTPEFLSLLNGFLSSAKTRIGRDLKFFYCHPFFHDTDWDSPKSFLRLLN